MDEYALKLKNQLTNYPKYRYQYHHEQLLEWEPKRLTDRLVDYEMEEWGYYS